MLKALRLEQGGEAGGCSGLRVASGKSPLRCGRLEGPAWGPGPLGVLTTEGSKDTRFGNWVPL